MIRPAVEDRAQVVGPLDGGRQPSVAAGQQGLESGFLGVAPGQSRAADPSKAVLEQADPPLQLVDRDEGLPLERASTPWE